MNKAEQRCLEAVELMTLGWRVVPCRCPLTRRRRCDECQGRGLVWLNQNGDIMMKPVTRHVRRMLTK